MEVDQEKSCSVANLPSVDYLGLHAAVGKTRIWISSSEWPHEHVWSNISATALITCNFFLHDPFLVHVLQNGVRNMEVFWRYSWMFWLFRHGCPIKPSGELDSTLYISVYSHFAITGGSQTPLGTFSSDRIELFSSLLVWASPLREDHGQSVWHSASPFPEHPFVASHLTADILVMNGFLSSSLRA